MNRQRTRRVRYHELRPRQIVQKRHEQPIAYLGLGVLEWHGFHNPVGLDGIKADALCTYLARRIGGLVLPPLFWGDHRGVLAEVVFDPEKSPWLPEGTEDQTNGIAEAMGISLERMKTDARRSEQEGGWQPWERLVEHMLFQIETLGFQRLVAVPGHYPLVPQLQNAIAAYHAKGGTVSILTLTDAMYAADGSSGDHAAAFETSMLLFLRPDLVRLSELGTRTTHSTLGILGDDPRLHASRSFGRRICTRMVQIVRHWIETT